MCGIAGIYAYAGHMPEDLNGAIDALLSGIAPRGHDATGLLALYRDGTTHLEKHITPASKFVHARQKVVGDPRTVMVHTRWATVGSAKDWKNAHPVQNGSLFAVHNGTIWNADGLFKIFDLARKAEVDSEILPALIRFAGWDHASDALALMTGGAAAAIVDSDRPDDLLLARTNSFPLVYATVGECIVWASDAKTVEEACRKGWPDQSFQAEVLGEGQVIRFDDGMPTFEEFTVKRSSSYEITGWGTNSKYWWDQDGIDEADWSTVPIRRAGKKNGKTSVWRRGDRGTGKHLVPAPIVPVSRTADLVLADEDVEIILDDDVFCDDCGDPILKKRAHLYHESVLCSECNDRTGFVGL